MQAASTASSIANVSSCPWVIASRFPNSTLVMVLLLLVASELKNSPRPGRHRQHGAGGHLTVGRPSPERTDHQRTTDAEHPEPEHDGNPDQHRACRAGQSDVGERMGGERGAADHDEVADQPGGERDDGAPDQRVAHERRRQDLRPVLLIAQRHQRSCVITTSSCTARPAGCARPPCGCRRGGSAVPR